jgi:hypothetical protein
VNGKYSYKKATNSIACNNSTFGDPVVDTPKTCYVQCDHLARKLGDTPLTCFVDSREFTLCAAENQTCSLAGTTPVEPVWYGVLYGANGKFAYRQETKSFVCNSAKFNNLKVDNARCYVKQ